MQHRFLPFLRWGRHVDARSLRADLVAGAVGAVFVLPQGLAFATLAGMPPQYGLYCAMVPTAVSALFGSSLHTVSGPTNAVSLFVFAALSPLAQPESPEYVSLALTLALLSGVTMVGLGLLRMGALVNFVSNDVIVGFTAGVGILIIVSQLGNFTGIAVPRGAPLPDTLKALEQGARELSPWVIVVSAATLAAAILSRRWLPRVPYMIVSILAGSVVAYLLNRWLGADRTGIHTIGALPRSLPPLSHPEFSLDTFAPLAASAIALTVVSLTQSISIARAIALKSGQRIDADQEFVGQGLGNIAASFFSGFPTSASVNRSGPNFESGARTPLAALFAALLLAAVVLLFAPLAAYLPLAAMAGSLFLVAWALIDFHRIRAAIRTSQASVTVIATTFLATLLLPIEFAVLTGVFASLILYLYRTSRPAMRSLIPDPAHPGRKFTEVHRGLQECPQAKILRIEGSIYFGAVHHVETHLETLREVRPEQKHLLVMAKSINFIDMAGAETLVGEARKRQAAGGALYFYSLRQPVESMLRRGGYLHEIGESNIFHSRDQAIAGVFARLDRSVCARCTARVFLECQTLPPPAAPGAV
ncbi:MAG TPA: SulP family inorganic anion transporter [Burkholderiales bacterium]|nr:SulP family inorganic anion transporter [Burkholderiales bacterium]